MIDRAFFFDYVRQDLFNGRLSQSQVDGLNLFLDYWETKQYDDCRWLAYILATVYHETARLFEAIEEWGKGVGKSYGRKDKQTGKVYYGRGFVQLTLKENYKKMGNLLGIDLVNHPELALEPEHSLQITMRGMIEGRFTGKKLSDYFNATTANWTGARAVVNGQDRAADIANYASSFYAAICILPY